MAAPKKRNKKKTSYKKLIILLWASVFVVLIGYIGFMVAISKGKFGELPNTRKLENPETPLATEVYSADGKLLGKYFSENRSYVEYDEISKNVYDALIATEDARFNKHSGIDARAVLRAIVFMGKRGGASTLSQQLAKNLFGRTNFETLPQKIIQKMKEWIMAVRLERYYTKEEIIKMYLNTVQFSGSSWGIKSASNTFFNKEPIDLNIQEAAVLVGMLKANTAYNPVKNPNDSKDRRNVVLNQMVEYEKISQKVYDSLKVLPIDLDYNVESHNQGIARYFREELRMYLNDWSEKTGYDIYKDGLRIYTTIDSRMQKYAEEAVRQHLTELQADFYKHWAKRKNAPFYRMNEKDVENLYISSIKRTDRYRKLKKQGKSWEQIFKNFKEAREMKVFSYAGEIDTVLSPYDSIKYYKWFLNPGFMAMETNSGHIKAWVGGIDYKYFKYDHVNKRARRQVGSTFKPFVYSTAIMNGYSPCQPVSNTPVIFTDFNNWKPQNSDGKYGGMLTIEEGLARSNNCVSAWIMKQVGPYAVIDLVNKMGIDTTLIPPYPSICLGTPDLSVYEMVGAFNTFGNKGFYVEPQFITRIETQDGEVIERFVPDEVEALDETYNYVVLNMLMNTSRLKGGTALRLRGKYKFTNQIAGKTGTTQNNSDGWFIGIVPQLTAGCWVGAEDRSVHFTSTHLGQGANMSLPIWALFMQKVYADASLGIEPIPFEKPLEELPKEIDCSNYYLEDNGYENNDNFNGGNY